MRLSAPIHRLKRAARVQARAEAIPLHAALDRIAGTEGFASWSLLARQHAGDTIDPIRLHALLAPGELVLIAARPRQGKTLLALKLALAALHAGNPAYVFSLDYTPRDIAGHLASMPPNLARFAARLGIDCSDTIAADHIMDRLAAAPRGTLAVVDYLQLLDQKRTNPPLQHQIEALSDFARTRGIILVFVCQIDRAFDPDTAPSPGPADIRLPNPLDLGLFDRAWFLHAGELRQTGSPGA
ncbi:MAG: hypothetical protein ABS76_38620 [Pelagibacterium sp. SCN 64-44]|nr:MAG: hypothetical protein ABS76_38620 [Pelagibacterium sp. SCN 64-44]